MVNPFTMSWDSIAPLNFSKPLDVLPHVKQRAEADRNLQGIFYAKRPDIVNRYDDAESSKLNETGMALENEADLSSMHDERLFREAQRSLAQISEN